MSDTIEKRLSVLESNMRTVVRELLLPLQADKTASKHDVTYGQRLLDRLVTIEDDLTDIRADVGDIADNVLDAPDDRTCKKVKSSTLAETIAKYNGLTVTASVLREASNQWRIVIKMLRNKQTQGEALRLLDAAGVTIERRGKFMYFKGY